MDFLRFTLGIRFQIHGDIAATASKAWSLLFAFLSSKEVEGLRLYGIHQPENEQEIEASYICIFSKASLKRCKNLYARISANPLLRSYLTLYRPYLQNNRLSAMNGFEFLGTVDESGFVSGGDTAYGEMHFVGAGSKVDPLVEEAPVFLLAPERFCGFLSSEEVIRELMRIAYAYFPYAEITPFPIAMGATGTVSAMVYALGGRYVPCRIALEGGDTLTAHYGILPDRTVVVEAATAAIAKAVLLDAAQDGYTSFVIGMDEVLAPGAALLSPAEDESLSHAQIQVLDRVVGIRTFLDRTMFDKFVQAASIVISGDGRAEQDGEVVGEICARCKKHNTQVVLLGGAPEPPRTAEEALAQLRDSANQLFHLLQMGNKLLHKA